MHILNTRSMQIKVWDGTGIFLSLMCVTHCVLTPLLAVALPVLLATEEPAHQGLAFAILIVGGVAFLLGYKKHQQADALLMGALGILVIGTAAFFSDSFFVEEIHGVSTEVALTLAGGTCLIIAHVRNMLLCRSCPACLDAHEPRSEF